MIYPATELRFINENIGYGVVAKEFIPKGTITWVRCSLDRIFSPAQVEALGPSYWPTIDKYAFNDSRGDFVLCWDLARFVNHSCEPTVLSPGFDFDIALRDIQPGEQLMCDYASLNLDNSFACACGSPSCRGEVHPFDWEHMADEWDVTLEAAVREIGNVEQPMWSFLPNPTQILAAARGQIPVPSCRAHFLPREVRPRVVAAAGAGR